MAGRPMMARGHALTGSLAGLATVPLVPSVTPVTAGLWVVLCTVAAGIPDLDMPGARLSRALWPVSLLAAYAFQWLAIFVFHLTRTDADDSHSDGHRGLTHTLVFPPLLAGAVWLLLAAWCPPWLGRQVAGAIVVGSYAHIAGDCCTRSACPVLWPLTWRGKRWARFGIPRALRFHTGGGRNKDWFGNPKVRWWDVHGERVVTKMLLVGNVLVAFTFVPGGYDLIFGVLGDAWQTIT